MARTDDWRFRIAIVAAAWAALTAIGANDVRRVDLVRERDLYAQYALVAGGKLKLGEASAVDGSLHSNDGVELRKGSTVHGDVSAVRDVKNLGASVTGRIVQRAPVVALPPLPGKAEARAQANRALNGPVKLVDPLVDDVLFVDGAVTIQGEARGAGRLIATAAITVTPRPGSSPGGDPSPGRRLSILGYSDLSVATGATLRATARIKGRATVGEQATFEGSLVADKEVELLRGARVRFGPPVDTTPPSLTILGPADPLVSATPAVEVSVLYGDAAPGLDLASFSLRLDGAAVTDRCSIAAATASCALALGASGRHDVTATIRDLAGNATTRSLVFTSILDAAPPAIAIESPADGVLVRDVEVTVIGVASDDGRVEIVLVNGLPVEATGGRFTSVVRLSDGANLIRITARDSTGKEGERTIAVTLDREPPRLTLRSPVAAQSPAPSAALPIATVRDSIVVAGSAEDDHGIERVDIAGAPAALAGGEFDRAVALAAGVNRVRVGAVDRAGNVAALDLDVDRRSVPAIAIEQPEDGALVLERSIAVRGRVDDPQATVTVNGRAAAVSGGTFTLDALPVEDGATLINVVAKGRSGIESSAGVTVLRDLEPPRVVIEDPADGALVYQSEVPVTGMVNDLVVGTVNGEQVSVSVNGVAAEVSNRTFLLDRLPLVEGENTIEVVAVDRSGNVGRDSIVVRRAAASGPTLVAWSGDHQTGVIGEALAMPLVAVVRDGQGAPVAGRLVTFAADGSDSTFVDGTRETAVATNVAGRATVMLTLGRRAGHHRVRATAAGIAGEALFVVRALPAEPVVLVVDSGDQQTGEVGQPLRAPLAVVVTDRGFNRLAGAVVHFEVLEGGGALDSTADSIDLLTDSDGRATARLTLGLDEGVGNNVVVARLADGPPEAEVTFAASALVAGDPAATSVSGVVLDNSDQPVPGATVTLESTTLSTRTDASGVFRLTGAPAGTTHLRVRGSTVERPGVWPSLDFLITILCGRDNSMGRPIFLPMLDPANALAVDETTGGVLTIADLPGFALEIAPGSVTFPGGGRSGVITVTPVHSDKVPMPPNFGQQPRFVITIQPGGARFEPPARVTYPNVDGLAPGQVTELYSFDHDLARFVSIGPGTVTGDGTRIVSDPGVGIAKAGWHGGGDPARPGTCHDCGDCRQLADGACVADDSRTPRQKAPDDCKAESCRDGRVVSSPDANETARPIHGNCFEERCREPRSVLDLGDAPAPRQCCGDPTLDPPIGRLAGIYEPAVECCIDHGRSLVNKKPPISVPLALCPDRKDDPSVETHYDGCSGGDLGSLTLYLSMVFLFSGDIDAPTPPRPGRDEPSDAAFADSASRAASCDRHDDCYQTCDSGSVARDGCDQRFYGDMLNTCGGVSGVYEYAEPETGRLLTANRQSLCEDFAAIYYTAVQTFGDGPFTNGQRKHCQCCA